VRGREQGTGNRDQGSVFDDWVATVLSPVVQ
jgi:hypothetical protein